MGGKALLDALQNNFTLTSLDLYENQIQNECLESIKDLIHRNFIIYKK